MKTLCGTIVVVFIAVLSIACSGSGSSSPTVTAPTTTPAGPATVESFDGTVDVSGSDVHPFTVTVASGPLSVTLTTAGPPPTIYMGLAVGTYSADGTCTPLSGATVLAQAGTVAQLSGTANAGSYCVKVYDAGNQLAPITYTVSVSHY